MDQESNGSGTDHASECDSERVIELLNASQAGDRRASDELFLILLPMLRKSAHRLMRSQPQGESLDTTVLVDELYLRLARGTDARTRDHYLSIASLALRQIVVERARYRGRVKRQIPGERVPIDEVVDRLQATGIDIVELNEEVARLGEIDPGAEKLITLRFYNDYSMEVCARILGKSLRAVERDWLVIKRHLGRRLGGRE